MELSPLADLDLENLRQDCFTKSICIIARAFKLGDLIEEPGENLNKSFSEVIAFREKHYVWGIVFHKHKSLVAYCSWLTDEVI